MKSPRRNLPGLLGLCLAVLLFPTPTPAQELPSPGPEHMELKKLEGDWVATIKGQGGESKGTMTYRMECGGLWLASTFKGDFGGQAFEGRGLDSYDPQKKKYVNVWVDSMSVRPMIFEGERNKDTKALTMIGEGPGMDGKPAKFKSVTQFPDADHITTKMSIVGSDGTEAEMMTIEYVRKK